MKWKPNVMSPELLFIEGEKVYLRPLLENYDDLQYLKWLNDPQINQFSNRLLWSCAELDLKQFLKKCHEKRDLLLAIIEKSNNLHIGNILLSDINWIHRKGELSILIGEKEWQGKGFAKEAWQLLTRHAFLNLNLHRLEAGTINPSMNNILETEGWVHEGTLRQVFSKEGKYYDAKRYGLLKEEFIEQENEL